MSKSFKAPLSLVIILGSLTAFGALSMDMYLPALPIVATDLHTTTSLTQLSLTACLIGMASGQLIFGPLSDRIGRRKPLFFTLLIFVVASILCALSQSIWMLIVMRFIQGASGAAGAVIARAAARDLYSGRALTKFIALLSLVNGAAPILAPIVGGFILQFTTWHTVFYILAGIGLAVFTAVVFRLEETLPEEKRATGGPLQTVKTFRNLVKDRYFMQLALAQALLMTAMFAYIAGSPFVLQNVYHLSPQAFSLCFAANGIGIIMMAQVTGKLSERFTELTLLKYSVMQAGIGACILLLAILVNTHVAVVLIGLFFIVSAVGMVSTTTFSLAMQAQGKNAGSASALLGLLPFVGGGIASPLVGLMGEANALPMAIVILFCTLLAVGNSFLIKAPAY